LEIRYYRPMQFQIDTGHDASQHRKIKELTTDQRENVGTLVVVTNELREKSNIPKGC